MRKQTAVEWLEQNMPNISNYIPLGIAIELLAKFQQAKKIEKEQIEDAYWEGGQDVPTTEQRCQDYFNQTYGGDK
jgi:hypothetical protein